MFFNAGDKNNIIINSTPQNEETLEKCKRCLKILLISLRLA